MVAAIMALLCAGSEAASPQLSYILPPGVQRGHEHVLTFTGAHVKDAEEALLYDAGITVKKLEVVDPQNVRVTVEVAPTCRLGEHIAVLQKARLKRTPVRASSASLGISESSHPGSVGQCCGRRV